MTMPRRAIYPDEVGSYAASAALQEAVNKGWLTDDQLKELSDRANDFALALLSGKVLRPNKETQLYDIVGREELEDDDNIVIDG